jgi:hypothetical protein
MAFKFFRSIYNDVLNHLKEEQAANQSPLDYDESPKFLPHTLASKHDKITAIELTPTTTKCSTYSPTTHLLHGPQ